MIGEVVVAVLVYISTITRTLRLMIAKIHTLIVHVYAQLGARLQATALVGNTCRKPMNPMKSMKLLVPTVDLSLGLLHQGRRGHLGPPWNRPLKVSGRTSHFQICCGPVTFRFFWESFLKLERLILFWLFHSCPGLSSGNLELTLILCALMQ